MGVEAAFTASQSMNQCRKLATHSQRPLDLVSGNTNYCVEIVGFKSFFASKLCVLASCGGLLSDRRILKSLS